jgi:hypothetical protein
MTIIESAEAAEVLRGCCLEGLRFFRRHFGLLGFGFVRGLYSLKRGGSISRSEMATLEESISRSEMTTLECDGSWFYQMPRIQ